MDLSKLSDSDLQQIAKGDLRMVSEQGLKMMAGEEDADPSHFRYKPDSPNPLWDALKTLPSSAARAGAGIIGLPQVLGDLADRAATKLTNLVGYDQDKSPVFGAIDRFVGDKLGINLKDPTPIQKQLGIQNLGDISLRGNKWLMGPLYHDPQTALGRVADFTAQNVLSGGTSKRGLLQSAAQGVSGGLLGEAGDTLLGTPGRIAGQIIGVLGAGFIPSLRSTPGSVAKDALEGVTDAQLAQAKSRQIQSAAQYVRLSYIVFVGR